MQDLLPDLETDSQNVPVGDRTGHHQPNYSGIIPGMSGNWPELAVPSRSGDVGNAAEVDVHG